MSLYFLNNIENKLKKSILKTEDLKLHKKNEVSVIPLFLKKESSYSFFNNFCVFFFNNLIYSFLYKTSKNTLNRKNKKKIFLIFLIFYKYFNFFFFKQNTFSTKKFIFKKKKLLFCSKVKNFPLSRKLIRFRRSIPIFKKKKKDFFKKYVSLKNIKFRKKNLLIFNKKFLKAFSKKRVEKNFIYTCMDKLSIYRFLKKSSKRTKASFFYFFDILSKRKFSNSFHKKYHYLFHYKHFTFSRRVKKKVKNYHKKKKRILLTFHRKWRRNLLLHFNIKVKKNSYVKIRRRFWKQCYPPFRDGPELFLLAKSFKINLDFVKGLSLKIKNVKRKLKFKRYFFSNKKNILKKKKKKKMKMRKNKFKSIFQDKVLGLYFSKFCEKLSKKRKDKKKFRKYFYSKKNLYKRNDNFVYFLRFKKKFFFFQSLKLFNKSYNFKKMSFIFHYYSFFLRKIFWKKRIFTKNFFLFFFSKFLFKKVPLFFNFKSLSVRINFLRRKRILKRFKIKIYGRKRWKYFFFKKRRRKKGRKVIRAWFRKKLLRLFIILLLLRFLKKNVNLKKIILLRNSNIMQNLKKFNLRFISYTFSDFSSFYFKMNNFISSTTFNDSVNNKYIYLLKKI